MFLSRLSVTKLFENYKCDPYLCVVLSSRSYLSNNSHLFLRELDLSSHDDKFIVTKIGTDYFSCPRKANV